jgi:hypothetical protein
MRQDGLGAAGTQHVGVVDVRTAGHHGVHQRQDLAPRKRPADPAAQAHGRVDQRLQTETDHQGGDQQQPGIGHQVRFVKGHHDPVDSVRYSRH